MKTLEMCIFVLSQLANAIPEDIESDTFGVLGEDENGREGFCDVSIIEYAGLAANLLNKFQWQETCNVPPSHEALLMLSDQGVIGVGFYNDTDGYWFDSNWSTVSEPTHWMLLPESPNAGE